MNTVTYSIPNINCGHCVHTIQTEIAEVPGVKTVVANNATKKAVITFDTPATEAIIKAKLVEINYPAAG